MRAFVKEKSGYLIKSLLGLIIILASALCMSLVSYAEDKLAKPIVIAETILNSQYSSYWDGNSSHNLISWDKVAGANMYYVYRRDNSKSKFSYLAKTTSTEYKDTKIKDNTTYYYIVKAVKVLNGKATLESDYSDVAHCITGLKRFPELTIYPPDDTNIAIGIKGSSADDYVIFYSDDKGKSYKEIRLLNNEANKILKPGSAGITELSGYVIGDLEPDKTYYIKVQTADVDKGVDNKGKIIRRKGTSDIVQVKTRKSSEINEKYITFSDGTYTRADVDEVYLFEAKQDDIKKLAKMKNLKEIEIIIFNGYDISPLSGLKDLESLVIQPNMYYAIKNSISDLSVLKEMKKLKKLTINRGDISDLSPLKKLKNLVDVSFIDNRISDLSPLEKLTKLKVLKIASNNITELKSLKKLKSLTYLDLSDNGISDISDLEKIRKLRYLCINNNNISDIESLLKIFRNADEYVSDEYFYPYKLEAKGNKFTKKDKIKIKKIAYLAVL